MGETAVQIGVGWPMRGSLGEDPGALAGSGIAPRLQRLARRSGDCSMIFAKDVDKGFISFSDGHPGNHATMFDPAGRRLAYLDHFSAFDDGKSWYTWAFLYGLFREGDRFVFATADREAVGVVEGGEIRVVDDPVDVIRGDGGKPLAVSARVIVPESESLPVSVAQMLPVAQVSIVNVPLLKSPSQPVIPSGPRPICPKVSVVTCSYNRPDLLRVAVESLRRQTDPDWEHLIYDDGSTDPRVESTLRWAEEDPRVRVWRGKKNRDRPAVAWNFLLDRALGRYFTVLDDDNEKLPRFVEVMARELDADPALGIVTCGWLVQRDGRRDEPYFLNLSTGVARIDEGSTCDGGAMLYRREVFDQVGHFSEEQRTNEDWDWLRRAVRVAKVKNLEECHATYRCHEVQRMTRSGSLGSDGDIVKLKTRVIQTSIGVRFVRPVASRLTRSQEDVCIGLERAISSIPWISLGGDIALVVSPFQMSDEEISTNVIGCLKAVSVHMEDPYALISNLERVRLMTTAVSELWVATNDASCVSAYKEIVGQRIIVYPSLSFDSTADVPANEKDVDVLLCGYAYPSRFRFVRELLTFLEGYRVHLVGDGWDRLAAEGLRSSALWSFCPTQDLDSTYKWHARSKAVVCLHRVHGDCSDGPVEPLTVNRGFMEGALGPRVFLDSSRPEHPFDEGDVVWYNTPADLAEKLRLYLDAPEAIERLARKCRLLYTYRERVARIVNCVRAPRYDVVIP